MIRLRSAVTIPAFTAHGLLPDGVHTTDLAELESRFGLANDRRRELFAKLIQFLDVVRGLAFSGASFAADGSFVTDKPSPGDIDGVLEVPLAAFAQVLSHMRPAGALFPMTVKARYEVHLFVQPALSPSWGMVEFFQTLRIEEAVSRTVLPTQRRGIVRVTL